MWDGCFEMPGQEPVHIQSSHVPPRTVTSSPKGIAETIVADVATMTLPTAQRPGSATTTRTIRMPERTRRFEIMAKCWLSALAIASFAWLCPSVLHIESRILDAAFAVLTFGAAMIVVEVALNWDIWGPTVVGGTLPANEELPLGELCSQIRGALKQYRPTGGELYDALVEATHRCCRIVNIAGNTTDLQVIEAVALVKSRLPALLTAYERTQAVGDPKELWAAVDRMAEAVVMVGDQAEAARKRLLALATDGLETEVRYLSARTGRDELGLSSILAPVN